MPLRRANLSWNARISATFGLSIDGFLGTIIGSTWFAGQDWNACGTRNCQGSLKLIPGIGSVAGGVIAATTAAALQHLVGTYLLR